MLRGLLREGGKKIGITMNRYDWDYDELVKIWDYGDWSEKAHVTRITFSRKNLFRRSLILHRGHGDGDRENGTRSSVTTGD